MSQTKPCACGSEFSVKSVYVEDPSPSALLAGVHAGTKRTFDSGATRDLDTDKLDYEGFLSVDVMIAFGEYMHAHRKMKDGSLRASDNWQKGMPLEAYIKSAFRHLVDLWYMHRHNVPAYSRPDGEQVTIEEALGGLFFNVQGYWLETLKAQQ